MVCIKHHGVMDMLHESLKAIFDIVKHLDACAIDLTSMPIVWLLVKRCLNPSSSHSCCIKLHACFHN